MLGNVLLANNLLGNVAPEAQAVAPKTLAQVLDGGRVKPFYLATVSVAKFLPLWILDTGSTWRIGETDNVTDVKVNGIQLSPQNSVATVNSNPGSWFWDGTTVYIQLSDSTDPNTEVNVVNAFLTFYFSQDSVDTNGRFWEGRIQSLPGTSIRIEENFGGLSQISGGTIKLINNDGFFDLRFGYQWDAGETVLQMGAEGIPFSEFKTLGTFLNTGKSKTDESFSIKIKEIKSRGEDVIPNTFYTRETFSLMNEDDVGRPIQLAYGTILGGRPVVIDRQTRTFKVAGHGIKSYQGVKVLTDQTWNTMSFASTDILNGEFTLNAVDWDGEQEVSVDFEGRLLPNGELMDNASDMVKDMLEQVGETRIDAAAFSAAKAELEAGFIFQNSDRKVNTRIPSIYISEETKVLDVIKKINMICGGFLKTSATGEYSWNVFSAQRGGSLPVFSDAEIENFSVGVSDVRELSKLTVRYGERIQEERRQAVTLERTKNQFNRNEEGPVVQTVDLNTNDTATTKQVGGRMLTLGEHQSISYSFTVKWGAFLLDAGDQIHLIYDRQGIDSILEIIEWKPIIGAKSEVKLKVGNLRGFDNKSGFWSLSTERTTTGASLDWSARERNYKRQNACHWHNANDFATNSPTDSEDYQTTVWAG